MFKEMQMNFQQMSSSKTCSSFENMQCKLKYFLRCSGKNLHSTVYHLFLKVSKKNQCGIMNVKTDVDCLNHLRFACSEWIRDKLITVP